MHGSRNETLWRRLAADGVRRTPQREAILEALEDAHDGLAMPTLLARGRRRAPGLGERTAERTVAMLVDRGAVDAIPRPDGGTVYRLCGRGHHHHLVCGVCGAVAQAERRGFVVDGHELTVHGTCAACRGLTPA